MHIFELHFTWRKIKFISERIITIEIEHIISSQIALAMKTTFFSF